MRIASNTVSDTMIRQIQQLTLDQANLQTQVATGRRITNPEDDPATIGRVLNLKSEQRELAQYGNNASRALNVAQASYSGLNALKKISDRAGELATLGTSAMGSDAMSAYATEVDQLIEQAVQSGNSKLGGDYLFGGTAVDAAPLSVTRDADGKITAIAFTASTDSASIALSETSSIRPGTTADTNQGIADFVSNLIALRDALASGVTASVSTAQTGLTDSEDLLIGAMADNGGAQTRISAARAQQADRTTDLESLVSAEANVDLPTTVVKLSQAQTAYQAALASASKVMSLSLLDYID